MTSNEEKVLRGLISSLREDVESLRRDIEALQVTYTKNTRTLKLHAETLRKSLRRKTRMVVIVLITISLAFVGGFISNRIVAKDIETVSLIEAERNCREINRLRSDISEYLHDIEDATGQDLNIQIFNPVECPRNGD